MELADGLVGRGKQIPALFCVQFLVLEHESQGLHVGVPYRSRLHKRLFSRFLEQEDVLLDFLVDKVEHIRRSVLVVRGRMATLKILFTDLCCLVTHRA